MRNAKGRVLSAGLLICLLGLSISASNRTSQSSAQPKVVTAVAPVYPPIAAAAHISGKVVVEVEIGPAGRVTSTRVSKGHPLLKSASSVAARQWKFAPNEDKVASRTVYLTFLFILTKKPLLEREDSVVFIPPYRVKIRYRYPPIDISMTH